MGKRNRHTKKEQPFSKLEDFYLPIIIALIAAVGFIIVALINSATAEKTTLMPIEATKTAESIHTFIAGETLTASALPTNTQPSTYTPTVTVTPTYTLTPAANLLISKTPSAAPTPTNEIKPDISVYTIVPGDTLADVSRETLGTRAYAQAIGRANCSYDPLDQAEKITVIAYTVQPGDVLGKISDSFAVSSSSIQFVNNFAGDTIYAGQKLIIPIYEICY